MSSFRPMLRRKYEETPAGLLAGTTISRWPCAQLFC
jgi:hypothetical protein